MNSEKEFLRKKNWWSDLDKYVFFPTLALILFGAISIFSISQHLTGKFYFSSNILLKKHLIFCVIGILTIVIISQFSLKNLIILSFFLFFLGIILSLSAIFFFPETKGANRWIKILGFSFQPSELLKPSFIIVSSVLLGRYKRKSDYSILFNILALAVISILLIFQPDYGMFILIFAAWFVQLLTSNMRLKIVLPIIISFFLIFIVVFFTLDHVKFRIMNFLFSEIGDNYQITKSLKSFSNGGLFGQGIGESSIAKNLPDVHSDFIFALIAEELGTIISLFILILYLTLYLRAHYIAQKCKNFFLITSLTGLSNILIFQVIINISSTLNIIPTKGMTLPFISYGGSSFISCSLIIGFILLLIKENKYA
ncbi:MAG: FtsW/RodA/SpoVE family cell cycle protein [Pseudomonadota bacterium]|nr:FtsW/RodA/SpoVE family cell cycle protein [Pseudomonadota bacterium]